MVAKFWHILGRPAMWISLPIFFVIQIFSDATPSAPNLVSKPSRLEELASNVSFALIVLMIFQAIAFCKRKFPKFLAEGKYPVLKYISIIMVAVFLSASVGVAANSVRLKIDGGEKARYDKAQELISAQTKRQLAIQAEAEAEASAKAKVEAVREAARVKKENQVKARKEHRLAIAKKKKEHRLAIAKKKKEAHDLAVARAFAVAQAERVKQARKNGGLTNSQIADLQTHSAWLKRASLTFGYGFTTGSAEACTQLNDNYPNLRDMHAVTPRIDDRLELVKNAYYESKRSCKKAFDHQNLQDLVEADSLAQSASYEISIILRYVRRH